ncbi:MAG: hypothetical protein KDD99_28865 [Bacteroidetes bacterium]|nr:hypothetical protein [Bacteroidota bacterium]
MKSPHIICFGSASRRDSLSQFCPRRIIKILNGISGSKFDEGGFVEMVVGDCDIFVSIVNQVSIL